LWAVLTTFFVTLLVSGGVAAWAIMNQVEGGGPGSPPRATALGGALRARNSGLFDGH
jgi:hypothetical protein